MALSRSVRSGLALLPVLVVWASLGGGAAAQEKPELTWYGFVKLDAAWDQGLVNAGNFARWVVSEDVFEGHGHFNMTARQTRLGFRAVTKAGGATLTGRWEADFYGGGAENKNALQVRHAYVEAVWPSGWSVLAGQASDIVSPLVPGTLNYTVAWWAGNIGYRRPQLKVARRVDLGGGKALRFEGGATRTIGDDFVSAEPGDSGADSELPTFQGLAGLSVPLGGQTLGLGVYGHWGDENLHRELGGEPVSVASSGWGVYATLPLGPAVSLAGEAWQGNNMDDYLGGIGQGIHVTGTSAEAITSTGGWAELTWRQGHTRLSAGLSVDDPERGDLGPAFRDENRTVWGTWSHDPGGGLTYGIEVSRWETRYVELRDAESWRVQMSVIYSF